VEIFPVPNVAVQAGDVIAYYGQGIPVDTGTGSDVRSYPTLAQPVEGNTILLGSADFPLVTEQRISSFDAQVIDTSAVSPLVGATATAYGGVDAVNLTNLGSGYTNPTVDFDLPDDPNGVQAQAHAEFDLATGEITAIVIDEPGSGYASAPGVAILDGTLFSPVAHTDGNFVVATGEATLAISEIQVNTFGSGYTSPPIVTISDLTGPGDGAAATAQVNAGGVSSIALTNPGTGYITTNGIKKFQDGLPMLCIPGPGQTFADCASNNLGQHIPVAVPDTTTFPDTDYYVIALVQHEEQMHSDLPPTMLREYVQLETAENFSWSKSVALQNDLLDGTSEPALLPDGSQAVAVDDPHFLGPIIVAQKDRAVRLVFYNLLPTGAKGDLFIPVDTTFMGAGMGPMDMMHVHNMSSVTDMVRNPECGELDRNRMDCFAESRATLHLHGGITPWISDGSPHQWITPANEMTMWPEGVSVRQVPDMVGASKPANVPDCSAADDGCMTFYYTNQQSARLMFYHDHSWGITRLNVYAGEAAGYLITDATEQALVNSGTIPADQIPLVIQDRTFVPNDAQLYDQFDPVTGERVSYGQDPTWDKTRWGDEGDLWYEHVYMPAQNPGDPGGMSAYGRWMYGPWFWPPADPEFPPIGNPYYDPACNLDDPATWQYDTDPFCEPQLIPGTPNNSAGMEQFNDTPIVNGTAYPTVTLEPKSYRLRILNAANDRFWNLQWYVGDPTTADPVLGPTEVALKAAELEAAQTDPTVFPTPDTAISPPGPNWIQIGTEGGFLPAPVVVPNQHITWIQDPTVFNVGNVDQHSLLLGPAERADVIVDFSKFAGKTLILYNDAPAAFPARVPSYDYYTGAPDMSPNGAPLILPGYGPNTRTIMQVKIQGTAAPAFNLTKLQTAFKHKANGTGVFESGQNPIIVGQAAYNSAYGKSFASAAWCNSPTNPTAKCDGFARISEQGGDMFKFDTLIGSQISVRVEPKAIHDETNSTNFEPFGRMSGNLGVEVAPANPGTQNVVLYPFVNPPTELFDATNLPDSSTITPIASADDGTQIWKFTHNGVDTHPIHFHLYDVQLLNRVSWDNIVSPPDPSELGWKDTVRVSPLEDTYFAIRPVLPVLPWEIPNSIRPINPMMPLNDTTMFNPTDPNGNPAPIFNQLINFGWEYMLHCHILSHEEMDMMRPVSVALPPVKPDGLAATVSAAGGGVTVNLSWNDNSIAETAYLIQRMTNGSGAWENVGTIPSPLDQVNGTGPRAFADTTAQPATAYQYQVVAQNTIGYGAEFPAMTVQSVSDPVVVAPSALPEVPLAPSDLTATLGFGPQVQLQWTDNANNETGFVVERSDNGGAFTTFGAFGALTGTGGSVTTPDITVLPGHTYDYRVYAVNAAGPSGFSNTATVVVPPISSTPTNLVLTVQGSRTTGPRIRLVFRDNQNGGTPETGFQVFRSDNGGAFSLLTTLPPRTGVGSVTYFDYAVVGGNTYSYYILTVNAGSVSLPSNTATASLPAVPAAPSNFTGTALITNLTTRINMSWTDNSTNESRFVIQRASDAAFTTALVSFNRAANSTTWAQTGIPFGTTYYYRIAAQNLYGYSAWVNLDPSPITTPVGMAPAAPSAFAATTTATSATRARADLSWVDNSNNETRFVIQRATDPNFTVNLVTYNRGANTTTFRNTGLLRGTTYYYRILAENLYGQSIWVFLTITTP